MAKRAIIYTRVSTDPQDKGYSPDTQLDACRRYAERLGFSVTAELQDTYSGATAVAERPKGKALVAMLKGREADAVVVYCVDRLSRDIVDLLASVRDWIRAGIEVHSCDIGRIQSELDIVLVIKGWQGSDERHKIRERTSRGRFGKAKAGKVVGQGKPPYGYAYVYETIAGSPKIVGLAIVRAEEKIVRLIYRWYVHGAENHTPMPVIAIARRLSQMKIPTPDKRKGARRRSPCMWDDGTINNILQNETYAGVSRYGKLIGPNGKSGKRPIEETVPVSVPAIVDRDVWNAAQERREYNKRMSRRNCKRTYLLRGLCKCGACGSAFTGVTNNSQNSYYHCCQRSNRFLGLEPICRAKYVRAHVLETKVWDYILDLWSDKKRFERILRNAQKAELDSLQPKRERLDSVLGLIADCEREAEDTARAMKRVKEGIVWEKLDREAEEIRQRHKELTKERDELLLALESRQLTDERINEALQQREDVVVGLQQPTFEGKRRMLEFLQVQVTVKDMKAWIQSIAPIKPVSIDLNISPYSEKTPKALPR